MGSPISFSIMGQVFAATMVLDYYAGLAREYAFEERRAGMLGPTLVRREPVGVVGGDRAVERAAVRHDAEARPALASGSTVVLKPAPETPLDAYLLAEVARGGRPARRACVNIVPAGREVGEHLVTHPDVDKVVVHRLHGGGPQDRVRSAASSSSAARSSSAASRRRSSSTTPTSRTTIAGPLPASLMNNGQACVAQTRILAPRARYDEVVDALAEAVSARRRSATRSTPRPTIGPLVASASATASRATSPRARRRAPASSSAAAVPPGSTKGWYVEPTVFADVDNDMTIAQEEIFGPVLSVIPYDDVDDAVAHRQRLRLRALRLGVDRRPEAGRRRRPPGAHRHLRRQRHGHGLRVALRRLQAVGHRPRARARGPRAYLEPKTIVLPPVSNLPDLVPHTLRVDVADVAPAGVRSIAVDVHAAGGAPRVPGRVCLRARRRHVAVATSISGRLRRVGNFSMARHLRDRGFVVVTVDPPAVGESDAPDDGYTLTPDVVADVNAFAIDHVLTRWPDALPIGVGHSAGALLTVVQQAASSNVRRARTARFRRWRPSPVRVRARSWKREPMPTTSGGDRRTDPPERFGRPLPRGSTATSEFLLGGMPVPEPVLDALGSVRSGLLAVVGLTSMIPGSVAREMAAVDVPVFLGLGEHDIAGDPQSIPACFTGSPEVTVYVLPDAGHNHNVAPDREVLWDRFASWAGQVPQVL